MTPTNDPTPPLRLLIVDDQPLIRRGLAMMLATEPGIEIVGQAADGLEAIEQALATHPDVVVMDLQMPRASGVVATREITAKLPATQVVVLTTYDDDELVFEAIRAGAQAYLLKDASEEEVLETVRAVHRGEARLSPAIARKVMAQFRTFAARAPERESAPPPGKPQRRVRRNLNADRRRRTAAEIRTPQRVRRTADRQGSAHPGPYRPRQEQQADRGRRVPGRGDREKLRQPHYGQASHTQPHRTGGARRWPARLTRRGVTFVIPNAPLTCPRS